MAGRKLTISRKHVIGSGRDLTFYSKSRIMLPSDLCFSIFTVTLILVPTVMCIIFTIFGNMTVDLKTKITLSVVDVFTMLICIWQLLKCSWTDPGIIPNPSAYNHSIRLTDEYIASKNMSIRGG